MGLPIDRTNFEADDFVAFADRLAADLKALRSLLQRSDFGAGACSLGAELEMHLIDERARPMACNEAVLRSADEPRLTLEINRFNLEYNAAPLLLAGAPFSALRRELESAQRCVAAAAERHGARVAVIGILPTLRMSDLGPKALTDAPRFHVLSRTLRELRGEPFRLHIEGQDALRISADDVSLEGANTSFQVHLRVPVDEFVRHYNAAQLAAAPVIAVSGNSPFFAERQLWEETRVALFKQAVDTRPPDARGLLPSRVSFGTRWIEDAVEPFSASVTLHAPLLPVVHGPPPDELLARGELPDLEALRLHHSTVWTWNRAIFDPAAGGHLRIEHRALPAGPSHVDMVANAAFTLGLSLELAKRIDELTRVFPFELASRNFYAASKHGLAAELSWPERGTVRARELVLALLPHAARGLLQAGVDRDDFEPLLEVVRARAETGRTGAQLQRKLFEHYARRMPRQEAFAATLEHYLDLARSGRPVHTWRPPPVSLRWSEVRAEN